MQSDVGIKKVRRISKTHWHALIAGDPTFALKVVEKVETIFKAHKDKDGTDLSKSVSTTMKAFENAYQTARGEFVRDTVLSPRLLTRDLLYARSKDLLPLDPEFSSEVSDACQLANPNPSLLVCGFDCDDKAHIFSVGNPGKIGNHDLTGFHAVGAGQRTALARLLMLDSNKNDSIALALYQAFDAKVNAEIVQSVGYAWDAEILMPGKSKNVPRNIINFVENVYAAFPKDPFMKQRWKYPRGNWKKRLHNYLVELLEDSPTRPRRKLTPRKSTSKP